MLQIKNQNIAICKVISCNTLRMLKKEHEQAGQKKIFLSSFIDIPSVLGLDVNEEQKKKKWSVVKHLERQISIKFRHNQYIIRKTVYKQYITGVISI